MASNSSVAVEIDNKSHDDMNESNKDKLCNENNDTTDNSEKEVLSVNSDSVEELVSAESVNTAKVISQLTLLFMSGSITELNKLTIAQLQLLNQKDFTAYMAKKPYLKNHKEEYKKKHGTEENYVPPPSDDYSRYCALMTAIVQKLRDTKLFDKFLSNVDGYFDKMQQLFTSEDDAYEQFKKDFASFKNIILRMNRIFNPDKSDTLDDFDTLYDYVKQYTVGSEQNMGFEDVLTSKAAQSLHIYARKDSSSKSDETDEEREEFVCALAKELYRNGTNLLCFYENRSVGDFRSFWVTDKEIGTPYTKVSTEEVLSVLSSSSFTIGSVHHTSLNSVKKCYMKKDFDSLHETLSVLLNSKASYKEKDGKFELVPMDIHFYEGEYTQENLSSLNQIPEQNIYNIVNGFPQSFDTLKPYAFVVFNFSGKAGDVNMKSYWMLIQPKEVLMETIVAQPKIETSSKDNEDNEDKNSIKAPDVMVFSKDDNDAFTWNELTINEFIERIQLPASIGTSCLH